MPFLIQHHAHHSVARASAGQRQQRHAPCTPACCAPCSGFSIRPLKPRSTEEPKAPAPSSMPSPTSVMLRFCFASCCSAVALQQQQHEVGRAARVAQEGGGVRENVRGWQRLGGQSQQGMGAGGKHGS